MYQFWNRNIYFVKFAIVEELLIVSTCNWYQTWISLTFSYAVNYHCELLFIKGKAGLFCFVPIICLSKPF